MATTHHSSACQRPEVLQVAVQFIPCAPPPPSPTRVDWQESAKRLNLTVNVIRKTRAVGIVPTSPTIYEVRLH